MISNEYKIILRCSKNKIKDRQIFSQLLDQLLLVCLRLILVGLPYYVFKLIELCTSNNLLFTSKATAEMIAACMEIMSYM